MSEQFRHEPLDDDLVRSGSFEPTRERARLGREPLFTGGDVAAFIVTLVMVCGPLAMGAFRL